MRSGIFVLFGLMCLVTSPAAAQLSGNFPGLSVIPGPVDADVYRVIDGDTFAFTAYPFPEMTVRGVLRMDGIDTPETRGKCTAEKALAAEATTFLLNTIEANRGRVRLYTVGLVGEDGGRFGRYRGSVRIGNIWLSDLMIEKGYARVNRGEPRKPWCPAP